MRRLVTCDAVRAATIPSTKILQQGFTLLEVMVALAILALVAVSASQASRSYLQSVSNLKTRSLAYFVAQNTLAELRINGVWLTGTDTRQVESQGQRWQITIVAQPTAIDNLEKVQIAVAPYDSAGNVGHNITDLEGVLTKSMEANP